MHVLTPMTKDKLLELLDPKAKEVIRYFIKKVYFLNQNHYLNKLPVRFRFQKNILNSGSCRL